MIQMNLLALLILFIFIFQIIIDFILGSARLETLGYWNKKFLTEARKKELEAQQSENQKIGIAPKFWALIREPIIVFLPLLFIIDGLVFRLGILYSPYLSFFNPIDIYLQIIGLIIIFFGLILYLISGKNIIKYVYSKATKERKMMTAGIFAYIRHPLYLSFILIPVGFILITLNLLSLLYFIAFTISTHPDEECDREGKFTFVTKEVRCEEEYMKKFYGKDYEEYIKKTGRLLPKFRK
ncbi:MAG: methyltransferase family protein [Promethearchaeota archaeon]|jgi:protein-S-isoprenylcysteine O-methyltransferase Ste14